jgi:hypothetical protein
VIKIKKKKKSHGGLKFLAVVCGITLLIVSFSIGRHTEVGERISGNREDRRIENTRLTPRFSYASAKLRITVGSIYYSDGATIDITTTSDVSIDRQSETASSDIAIEPTATEVAPGVAAVPYDSFRDSWTEILTKDHRYISPENDDAAWTRYEMAPYYYATAIDPHYIPMIDDIMGFELRDMPTKASVAVPASGLMAMVRPAVNTPEVPSAVIDSYSYEMDMTTFRRVLPILATRTDLGFDEVGLVRFADVSIADSVATTFVQALGDQREASYHYTLEVTDIAGEPVDIDVPTNVVDGEIDSPDDSATDTTP